MLFKPMFRCLAGIYLVLGIGVLCAQDTGTILVQARRRATTEKKPADALRLLADYLRVHPNDSDALVMQGLILSWEGRYEEARRSLEMVLAKDPDYSDAVLGLCNVEMWSGNPYRAEQVAREALQRRPDYEPYKEAQRKALAQIESERKSKREKMREWRELKNGDTWQAVVSQDSTFFGDGRSPFIEQQVGIKHVFAYGTYLLRATRATQYGYHSQLFELDSYPRIRPGTYAFFNLGFSPDRQLFPAYRMGAELFQNIGHGLEASGGFRRLGFKDKIQVYTGSFSKYRGNWFYSVRTFMTPDSKQGTSKSVQFWVRKYFGDGVNYAGVRYGRGASPFEIQSTLQTGVLNANTFMGEWNWALGPRFLCTALAGTAKEDRIDGAGLAQYFSEITIAYRF